MADAKFKQRKGGPYRLITVEDEINEDVLSEEAKKKLMKSKKKKSYKDTINDMIDEI